MERVLGWRVYGLGIVALALVCLAWGDFDPGQRVPRDFPARTVLAYVAAIFMLIAGTAVEWRRTTPSGAAALMAYFTFVVVILMGGRVMLRNHDVYAAYGGTAEQLALAAGGLIVYAGSANMGSVRAQRLTRWGQRVFGVCALVFGGAHFVYPQVTASFVPSWLPPSPTFWAIATGVAHIAAGVAILAGVQARLAAILLTVMYASFTPLVHVPRLLADHSRENWSENALNLALVGVAWVVADSLDRSWRDSLGEPARTAQASRGP